MRKSLTATTERFLPELARFVDKTAVCGFDSCHSVFQNKSPDQRKGYSGQKLEWNVERVSRAMRVHLKNVPRITTV